MIPTRIYIISYYHRVMKYYYIRIIYLYIQIQQFQNEQEYVEQDAILGMIKFKIVNKIFILKIKTHQQNISS